MNCPIKKVFIAPFTYTVTMDEALATVAGAKGVCGNDVHDIRLDPQQALGSMQDTLLHETMHAMTDQAGAQGKLVNLTEDQEEFIVASIATRTLALLRDNPTLVKFLLS